MGADSIFQFKQPLLPPDSGTAQKHMGFDAYILDEPGTDHFVDINTQKLMGFIFHTKPQGSDISIGTADGDHIHRANI